LSTFYYFDEEEQGFVQVEYKPVERLFHTASQLLLYGVVISALLLVLLSTYAGTPAELALKAENKELLLQLNRTRSTILSLDQDLKRLAQTDNELYREMLGIDPISPDERLAGTGGSDELQKFDMYNAESAEVLKWTSSNLESLERRINIQKLSLEEIKQFYNENQQMMMHIPAIRPINSVVISDFGMRLHPVYRFRRMHEGIDFRARIGTPVYATGDGRVSMSSRYSTYGLTVKIDHGYGYESLYAHLSAFAPGMRPGRRVTRGELIGYTGNTGIVEGPHLHYEIHKDGRPVNPLNYMFADISPEEYVTLRRINDSDSQADMN
jgi:murein DD-endopeptidase MepM/ murein hydrolase activator NlpD